MAIVMVTTAGKSSAEKYYYINEDFSNFSSLKYSITELNGWCFDRCATQNINNYVLNIQNSATTPTLDLDGDAKFSVQYRRINTSSASTITVSIIGDGSFKDSNSTFSSIDLDASSDWQTFSADIVGGGENTKIRFAKKSGGDFRIDDVSVSVERLASPTFSLYEGYYHGTQTTTITNNEAGATVYYTTDGTDPTSLSANYSSAITIDRPMTLKAIAYKDGQASSITTAHYYVGNFYFAESFNRFAATGGNDGIFVENSEVATASSLDNPSASITNVNVAYKCVELTGYGSSDGVFTTTSLSLGKSAVLKFRVAGTTGGDKTLKVSLSEHYGQNQTTNYDRTFTAKSGEWTEYTMGLSTLYENSTQTITFSGKGCFLDEVLIVDVPAEVLVLSETDNTETTSPLLTDNDKVVRNVRLTRTLPANIWNTLCLPFRIHRHDLLALSKSLTGTDIQLFTYTSFENEEMKFTSATEVSAGTPFLLRMTVNCENPTFWAVTVENAAPQSVTCGDVSWVGVYNPTKLAIDGTNLFLGIDNNLYKPAADKNTINGLRAYIQKPVGMNVRLVMDDESAGIQMVEAGGNGSRRWFTLEGQQVKIPQKSGIYVTEGKKVIIR